MRNNTTLRTRLGSQNWLLSETQDGRLTPSVSTIGSRKQSRPPIVLDSGEDVFGHFIFNMQNNICRCRLYNPFHLLMYPLRPIPLLVPTSYPCDSVTPARNHHIDIATTSSSSHHPTLKNSATSFLFQPLVYPSSSKAEFSSHAFLPLEAVPALVTFVTNNNPGGPWQILPTYPRYSVVLDGRAASIMQCYNGSEGPMFSYGGGFAIEVNFEQPLSSCHMPMATGQ